MYQRLQQQLEGRSGRQEKGYRRFFSEEPVQNNNIQIAIKNTKLNIDKGNFDGRLEAAQEAIQAFADQNEIIYQSHGHGYGSLSVNSVAHSITPYGIDVSMMLQFCGINESELTRQPECK
ncbi:hypothetical protein [Legionella sp. WA2022007384]